MAQKINFLKTSQLISYPNNFIVRYKYVLRLTEG
jgi:hypothetical protein